MMQRENQDFSVQALRIAVDEVLQALAPKLEGFVPRVFIVLGSGLGALARSVEEVASFTFAEIPHFPEPKVESHHGRLVFGKLGGQKVAVMSGRFHLYEGHAPQSWIPPVRAMRKLGCETMLVTNAAGALHAGLKVPSLMIIRDHINGLARSPLCGPNDDEVGPRFPDMTEVYDPKLRELLHAAARENNLSVSEGVYWGTLGPTFETAAEVKMMASLGADAVGMSTISEVIIARHCGMKIAGVSSITNATAGVATTPQTMEEVIAGGAALAKGLKGLVEGFLRKLNESAE
ncbi:MAG: purine-nucleoside phosphorylase [Planctomycetes bacterium]|nr:purine-nucleoside phosphorylase [Planctomycetota bacterium]